MSYFQDTWRTAASEWAMYMYIGSCMYVIGLVFWREQAKELVSRLLEPVLISGTVTHHLE